MVQRPVHMEPSPVHTLVLKVCITIWRSECLKCLLPSIIWDIKFIFTASLLWFFSVVNWTVLNLTHNNFICTRTDIRSFNIKCAKHCKIKPPLTQLPGFVAKKGLLTGKIYQKVAKMGVDGPSWLRCLGTKSYTLLESSGFVDLWPIFHSQPMKCFIIC
jgi:hypothetical protein